MSTQPDVPALPGEYEGVLGEALEYIIDGLAGPEAKATVENTIRSAIEHNFGGGWLAFCLGEEQES